MIQKSTTATTTTTTIISILTTIFYVNLGWPGSLPQFSSSTCFETEPLRTHGTSSSQTGCPSCHATNSVSLKAPKKTQSTGPNQWPGLILSSSTNSWEERCSPYISSSMALPSKLYSVKKNVNDHSHTSINEVFPTPTAPVMRTGRL